MSEQFGLGKAPYQNPFYRKMRPIEGPTIDLQIDYVGPNQNNPELTFSKEGVEKLELQFVTWFGTRLARFTEETGVGAKHATVTITVELEP